MNTPANTSTPARRKGPAWGDSPLARALRSQPRPLINPRERLIVLWSPKAACTVILLWHLSRLGRLAEAEGHHHWPHRFRLDVLEREAAHQEALAALAAPGGAEGWTVLRFLRDPFRRAVSMYRHSLRSPILPQARGWPLSLFDPPILTAVAGYSFRQFLDCVLATSPRRRNVHLWPQRHPLESLLAPGVVINADAGDLHAQIAAFEVAAGLAPTDFATTDWAQRTASRHHARPEAAAAGTMVDTPLRRVDAMGNGPRPWPAPDAFRTPDSEALVRRLYAQDYAAYF